ACGRSGRGPAIMCGTASLCALRVAPEASSGGGTDHGRASSCPSAPLLSSAPLPPVLRPSHSLVPVAWRLPGPRWVPVVFIPVSALRMREARPVRCALLEAGVAPFGGLVGHVRQAGGLPGGDVLAHETGIGQVEGELPHPRGLWGLGGDGRGHRQRLVLDPLVSDDPVDCAPVVGVLGRVLLGEEENLPGPLLPDL